MGYKVPVGVSNKHLHLSQADLDTLFGAGYQLTFKKALGQPGQFAAEEQVTVVGPKGQSKMRVLGPVRPETQVEIAMTDSRALGIPGMVRESGKLDGTPGCKLIGPKGEVDIPKGVIVALRHVHLNPEQAKAAGVVDKEFVKIRVGGERGLVFENVLVRAGSTHEAEFHLDTDEANASGLMGGEVEIYKD